MDEMRQQTIEEEILPAQYSIAFQENMDPHDRREGGVFYTSEEVIDRLIDPLFMNDLLKERETCRGNRWMVSAFWEKLGRLTFLDPACGCGNFLVRIYERLRELELSVVEELYGTGQRVMDLSLYCRISPAQFLGIEIEPAQAEMARECLWLTKRRIDRKMEEMFGLEPSEPEKTCPFAIRIGNALTEDWGSLANRDRLDFIVGNPPFAGARLMTPSQKMDMRLVFHGMKGLGNLDYVTAWYRRAAEFMTGTHIRAAFVSTNSICQGEQAGILWKDLKEKFGMGIDFAWRTFRWDSAGQGQASVHCVIVGFSDRSRGGRNKSLVLYDAEGGRKVPHINAYLVSGPDVWLKARKEPVGKLPEMTFGSMANDEGHLLLSAREREALLAASPEAEKWIRRFLGSEELIRGRERYCLWIPAAETEEACEIPEIRSRVEKVKEYRNRSRRAATRLQAQTPYAFGEIRQPGEGMFREEERMLLVPRVSSGRRDVLPMILVPEKNCIASDALLMVPSADEGLLALLSSRLHMVWVRAVAGRLKSDYRYSASLVYNCFPWKEPEEKLMASILESGKEILTVRAGYPEASLAWLYDPETMPDDLKEAHSRADRLIEQAFRCESRSEEEQLALLFSRLRKYLDKE